MGEEEERDGGVVVSSSGVGSVSDRYDGVGVVVGGGGCGSGVYGVGEEEGNDGKVTGLGGLEKRIVVDVGRIDRGESEEESNDLCVAVAGGKAEGFVPAGGRIGSSIVEKEVENVNMSVFGGNSERRRKVGVGINTIIRQKFGYHPCIPRPRCPHDRVVLAPP